MMDIETMIERTMTSLEKNELLTYQIDFIAKIAKGNMNQNHPYGKTMRNMLKLISNRKDRVNIHKVLKIKAHFVDEK